MGAECKAGREPAQQSEQHLKLTVIVAASCNNKIADRQPFVQRFFIFIASVSVIIVRVRRIDFTVNSCGGKLKTFPFLCSEIQAEIQLGLHRKNITNLFLNFCKWHYRISR
jgi:hypothetical protein